MRFGMFDLIMFTGSIALGMRGALALLPWWKSLFPGHPRAAFVPWLMTMLVLGTASYVVVASLVYWVLGVMPLLLPTCPHCGKRPDRYTITGAGWPRLRAVCGHCERPTDLWWRRPRPADLAPDRPSLLLSWPQAIGRWRLIAAGSPLPTAPPGEINRPT